MIPILDLRPESGSGSLGFNSGIMGSEFDEHEDELDFLEAFRAQYVH
jgi:hypothetical protein